MENASDNAEFRERFLKTHRDCFVRERPATQKDHDPAGERVWKIHFLVADATKSGLFRMKKIGSQLEFGVV